MAKTTGLSWSTYVIPEAIMAGMLDVNSARTMPRFGRCSYCRGVVDSTRENCRTCGAPANAVG